MIDLQVSPRIVPVSSTGIVTRLSDLRRELEHIEDWPECELSAAMLLGDVCKYLGLSEADRAKVLGEKGAALVAEIEGAHVTLCA